MFAEINLVDSAIHARSSLLPFQLSFCTKTFQDLLRSCHRHKYISHRPSLLLLGQANTMGGAAFAVAVAEGEPTLRTPRMSPETYRLLKEILVKKLQAYFPTGKVVPLIEAPEKEDYGDLDIFVALDETPDFLALAAYLGAAGMIYHDPTKATFAVPRDGTASKYPCVLYRDTNTIGNASKVEPARSSSIDEFAQLDVAIVAPDLLDWYTFYSSYSDMNGLLGHIVTQLGFTGTRFNLNVHVHMLISHIRNSHRPRLLA